MLSLLELTVITREMRCKPVLLDCVRFSLLPLTVLETELAAIAATTTKVESTTAIAATTTKVESTTAIAATTTKVESTTDLKSKKKTDRKPEKKNYYCDRQWALSGVSPWVNARLTNMFNEIDDYPHDFNKNRERMIKGLKNWKYQQKYRLTEIDIKRIDYVIKCFS